jgi:hypothetical protein
MSYGTFTTAAMVSSMTAHDGCRLRDEWVGPKALLASLVRQRSAVVVLYKICKGIISFVLLAWEIVRAMSFPTIQGEP